MQTIAPPRRIAPSVVDVLSVSPRWEDHSGLERILDEAAQMPLEWRCRLSIAVSLSSALRLLRQVRFPIVLCEEHLPLGDWRDLLEQTRQLGRPPFLIVTSRHADDYLWAEALNLGAYDVLAKPFDRNETARVLRMAALRWNAELEGGAQT